MKRRGTNLVELLVTMSACAVILTLSASLIHRAMQANSKARLQQSVESTALRLANCFRRDAHAASAATTDALPDGTIVSFRLPRSQTAEYRQAEGRVERLLLDGGNVKARELFAFPEGNVLAATSDASGSIALAARFAPAAKGEEPAYSAFSMPVRLRVEAVIGKHGSFEEVDLKEPADDAN